MKRSVPATPFRVIGGGDQGDFTTSSESPETPATMNPQAEAASSSTTPSGSGLQLAPASSRQATQLAPMTYGQSSQAATSSSGQVSAVANVQHQHHQHLHQNTQRNTVNDIDPQQLEDMVNSLVAARVDVATCCNKLGKK